MASPPVSGEKPLTTDQIRERANDWNLASDVGLLATLQSFSERLCSRAEEVKAELAGLLADSADAQCRVQTAATQLMLVSNSRFVESRVYEDDSAETVAAAAAPEKQTVSKEDAQKETHSRLCEALALGGELVDRAYERLEVSDSDSDGDSSDSLPLAVEPVDPYLHRPLPYIIGSRQFADDDSVGLQLGGGPPPADTEDDLTDQETTGELLDGTGDTGDVFAPAAPAPAPAAPAPARAAAHPPADDAWSDSSGDMFDPGTQAAPGVAVQKAKSLEREEPPRRQTRARAPLEGDLFAPESDSGSEAGDGELFGAGRPAAAAGLWAGAAAPAAAGEDSRRQGMKRSDQLPPDDLGSDGSSPGGEDPAPAPPAAAAQPPTPTRRLPAGAVAMFGGLDPFSAPRRREGDSSSSDEDDDRPAAAAAAAGRQKRRGPRLHARPINSERSTVPVSDDEEDLFGGRTAAAPADRHPGRPAPAASHSPAPAPARAAAAQPAQRSGVVAVKPSASLFSSSDDEDMFHVAAKASEAAAKTAAAVRKPAAGPPATVPTASTAAPAAAKPLPKGLFDSDSDDDIFSLVAPGRAKTPPRAADAGRRADPLADSPPSVQSSGVATATARPPFSTGVENVRAMGPTAPGPSAPAVSAAAGTAPTVPAAAAKPPEKPAAQKAKPPVSSLFSSSSEEDLFASSASTGRAPEAKPKATVSVPAPAVEPTPPPAPTAAQAPAPQSAPEPAPAPAPAPVASAAAPSADVAAKLTTAASKAAPAAAAPAAKAKKAVSASLFDSDSDEDDLFHPAVGSRTAASAKATSASTAMTKPASRAPVNEKAQETPNNSAAAKPVDEHRPAKGSAISPDAVFPPVEPTAGPSENRAPSPAAVDAPDSPGVVRRSGGGPSGARPVSAGLSALTASIEHQLGSSARRRSGGPAGGVALFGAAGQTAARLSPSPPVSPTTHPPADGAREVGSPPESPSQSPVRSPAAAAAGVPPPEVVRRRPEPKRRTRPASVPAGRQEVSSPPPTHTAADLGPADPFDTLPSLTKERPRGPVKRRPSRKKPGSSRLSLPPESSQFQSVTSHAPADEPPEDRPAPSAAAGAVRRPPAGGQRLPGLINAELRGRLARRTGSDAADGTDGSGGPPLSPETPDPSAGGAAPVPDTAPDRGSADVRAALGGIPEDPSAARSQTAVSPAVAADSVRTGSTVPETPVASDRTTLPTALHPVVPETPAAPSPTDLARPSVPARPAAAPPPAGLTPAPTPGEAAVSPAARAAASLFDSDSDEDLFHMPAPRPAQRGTETSVASGAPRVAGDLQKTVAKSAVIPPLSAKPESVAVSGSQEVTGSEQDLPTNGERSTETAFKAASIAARSKSDTSPSPKPELKPKPGSSHPVPQPSVISDPSAREMPPEEDSTLPPAPPPPPAGGLFDDSDEEDLFHSVPAPRPAAGAAGASSPTLGTPAGAQTKDDEGGSEDGDKTTAKEELAGTQADERGSEANKPGSAEENATVRDEATALTPADDNHSVPRTGSTPVDQPSSPALVTAAAAPGPVKSASAPGPVKADHGIFDSDSDEDLFQTKQKSKPAVKEPIDAPKASLAEQRSIPPETLPSVTLPAGSREQDAKRSPEDDVNRVSVSHKEGDEGPVSSETKRPSEEKAEMSSDPVTQNNAAEPPTPSQHPKTSRSVFNSDSEEDLFQTVSSKPKSAHVPGAAPVSENVSPAPKANPPAAVTDHSPLEAAVQEVKTPSPSGSHHDTDRPADRQLPQSCDGPEPSVEVAVSGDLTSPSPGGGRRSPPGDVRSAQDELTTPDVAKGHDKTRTDGGGSSGGLSEAEREGAVPASSQQESPPGGTTSDTLESEAPGAAKTAALDADEPMFSEPKLVADDMTPEATVAPSAPDTTNATVAAPPSPQTSVVSESDPIPPAPAASTAAKSSRSIFDSDSDEEDLFQTMKPKSAVKTPATGQKSPSLRASAMSATVTHTETNDPTARMKDATSGVTDNIVNSSNPVNQKSSATVTAIDEKKAANTEPPTVSPGATSPPAPLGKSGGSLFDSDSDDDLFRSTKRSKPTPAKGVAVKDSAVTKPASEAPSSVVSKGKNIQNVEKKPSKSPSDIGEIKPVSHPGKETPKSVILPRTPRKETKPSRGLFSSDSDEDDLFSTAKNRPAVTPSPTTNKRSSPARQPQSAATAPAAAVEPPRVGGSPLSVSAAAPPQTAAPVSAPTPVRTSPAAARPAVPPSAEDSDDDDLFGSTRNAPRPASQKEEGWERAAAAASRAQPPARTSASPSVTGSGKARAAPTVPKTARAPPPGSLFSDDDDDADLFSSAKTAPAARAPVRAGARLFSDSEEDEATPTQAARHADHPNRTGAVSAAVPAGHGVSAEPVKPQLKPATFDPLSGLLGD